MYKWQEPIWCGIHPVSAKVPDSSLVLNMHLAKVGAQRGTVTEYILQDHVYVLYLWTVVVEIKFGGDNMLDNVTQGNIISRNGIITLRHAPVNQPKNVDGTRFRNNVLILKFTCALTND